MNSIGIDELLNMNNTIIIDIRNNNSYIKSHMPGAINIEERELLTNYDKYLNYDNTYYLYCFSGIRSSILTKKLNRMGYHTVNVEGGFYHYLLKR